MTYLSLNGVKTGGWTITTIIQIKYFMSLSYQQLKYQISQIVYNRNFRNGALYTVFSFVNSGISFILLLILARYLTPFDYGKLNLFTTFITLINLLITLCTTSYISVSFFQKDSPTLRKVILITFGTTTLMLVIFSILLLLFPEFMVRIIGISNGYLWLGLLICYFQVFNTVNLDIWRLEEKPIFYGFYSVSFAICNFGLSFWMIVGLNFGWQGRVYAWWLLSVLYFIISIIFLIKRKYLVISKLEISLIKESLIYSLPLLPHTVSFWLKQGLDRYIINYFHNQEIVGYFSFALNLAAIINIIGTAFNATNSVYIYKRLAEGYEKVRSILTKQTKVMTGCFLIISIGVILFACSMIIFLLPKYSYSIQYILPLCLGGFFQCVYLLWVNYLFFYKKTTILMSITLSTALLQIILSLWLTRYSALYTAWISMCITFISATMVIYVSRNTLAKQIKNSNLYESKN